MFDRPSTDRPYPTEAAFHADLYNPLFTEDSEAARLFRATVNQQLIDSPNLVLSPNDERIRQKWLKRDSISNGGAQ